MPGKVDALLNQKLEKVEWGEFRIGDLFEIKTGRDVIIGKVESGDIPLISHQHEDNGITKHIKLLDDRNLFNHKCTIALADRGVFFATIQDVDFHIGTRVKALIFNDGEKSKKVRLFFASAINKNQILFTAYSENATNKLPEVTIELPTKNGNIDYEFMESFIAELEAQRIAELEAYLLATGLDDYNLTTEEKQVLEDFESEKFAWREFSLSLIHI